MLKELHEEMLTHLGLVVDEGHVTLDDKIVKLHNKDLVTYHNKFLRPGSSERFIIFSPCSEDITLGKSLTVSFYEKTMSARINYIVTETLIRLLELYKLEDQSKLSRRNVHALSYYPTVANKTQLTTMRRYFKKKILDKYNLAKVTLKPSASKGSLRELVITSPLLNKLRTDTGVYDFIQEVGGVKASKVTIDKIIEVLEVFEDIFDDGILATGSIQDPSPSVACMLRGLEKFYAFFKPMTFDGLECDMEIFDIEYYLEDHLALTKDIAKLPPLAGNKGSIRKGKGAKIENNNQDKEENKGKKTQPNQTIRNEPEEKSKPISEENTQETVRRPRHEPKANSHFKVPLGLNNGIDYKSVPNPPKMVTIRSKEMILDQGTNTLVEREVLREVLETDLPPEYKKPPKPKTADDLAPRGVPSYLRGKVSEEYADVSKLDAINERKYQEALMSINKQQNSYNPYLSPGENRLNKQANGFMDNDPPPFVPDPPRSTATPSNNGLPPAPPGYVWENVYNPDTGQWQWKTVPSQHNNRVPPTQTPHHQVQHHQTQHHQPQSTSLPQPTPGYRWETIVDPNTGQASYKQVPIGNSGVQQPRRNVRRF